MSKKVWIVENREVSDCPNRCWSTVVMYVASSKKKAEKWIKEQIKEHYGDDWYWWAVYSQNINQDIMECSGDELYYYYKDGTPALVYQPTLPEETPYIQKEEEE